MFGCVLASIPRLFSAFSWNSGSLVWSEPKNNNYKKIKIFINLGYNAPMPTKNLVYLLRFVSAYKIQQSRTK